MAKFKTSNIGNILKAGLGVVGIGAVGAAASSGGGIGALASGATQTALYLAVGGVLLLVILKK